MKNYRHVTLLAAFLGLLVCISTAQAQTYKWTDEHARTYFTDDLSKVPEKYRDSAVRIGEPEKEPKKEWWMQYDKNRPAHPELLQREQSQRTSDLAEELLRKGYALSYEWTQDMSLWIKIPACTAVRKEEYSDMAAQIASHYHAKKGSLICVRFYYGSGNVIAYECR
jgi:viroplasmin and RNaseH domain-containing protein